jgi:hypothetical protein
MVGVWIFSGTTHSHFGALDLIQLSSQYIKSFILKPARFFWPVMFHLKLSDLNKKIKITGLLTLLRETVKF